ncbi:hypothetical protein [Halorarum salinum]|uniref:Uncharacterized protein n=1 Tax=Halorarum salinum TaxID=2743089 RepID=A0A7D5LCG9_9EURY|nr:hypothetical protein [Halobaculum salinum]QLG62755.1 hypothetical protein HUG12_13875 [Halobaculum salinum]
MYPVSPVVAALARIAARIAAVPRRVAVRVRGVLTDEALRPALLYLLALSLGFASFVTYLLRGGGDVTRVEIGLQLGSFGTVFYTSLVGAGTARR